MAAQRAHRALYIVHQNFQEMRAIRALQNTSP